MEFHWLYAHYKDCQGTAVICCLQSLSTCCSTNLVPLAFVMDSLLKQIENIFSSLPFFFFVCVCEKSVFLLALAFPQNSCLLAAADGVVVHEQIDKLSSASIKTAHLRHKGLLLGVVRALLKKEAWGWALWSWNDCQLQSKLTEFHLTFPHTTSAPLLYFFLFFFGCQS